MGALEKRMKENFEQGATPTQDSAVSLPTLTMLASLPFLSTYALRRLLLVGNEAVDPTFTMTRWSDANYTVDKAQLLIILNESRPGILG
jgi:hypothetical protein